MKRKHTAKRARYSDQRALAIVQQHVPFATAVQDAKHDLEIEVSRSDVSASKRKAHAECALATACMRTGFAAAIVSKSRVYLVDHNGLALRFCVNDSVAREIVAFDRGAAFEAGTYMLKAPTPMQRIGHGYARGYGQKKSTRHKAHVTQNVRTTLA
jgi:hypothetical protein